MFNEFNEGDGGTVFAPDLTQPSKEALIHLLRHKEKWPEGFAFQFSNCTTCAMGLTQRVWPEKVRYPITCAVGDAIGITRDDASRIFCHGRGLLSTPEDIAELLEAV